MDDAVLDLAPLLMQGHTVVPLRGIFVVPIEDIVDKPFKSVESCDMDAAPCMDFAEVR
jgi:hypothetical protein